MSAHCLKSLACTTLLSSCPLGKASSTVLHETGGAGKNLSSIHSGFSSSIHSDNNTSEKIRQLWSIIWQRHSTVPVIMGVQQLLYTSANRLSKHRNIYAFSFCKGSLFRASFTIRYAGELIQELAESQVIIFHVSKALPQHCSQLTFHWPPELPENNYHQHPTYRPWTTETPPMGHVKKHQIQAYSVCRNDSFRWYSSTISCEPVLVFNSEWGIQLSIFAWRVLRDHWCSAVWGQLRQSSRVVEYLMTHGPMTYYCSP